MKCRYRKCFILLSIFWVAGTVFNWGGVAWPSGQDSMGQNGITQKGDVDASDNKMDIFGVTRSLYLLAMFGAGICFFVAQTSRRPVVQFVFNINPAWADHSMWRLVEAIIFSVIGGIAGAVIVQPMTPPQAISAGLSWTGIVAGIKERKHES